MHDLVLKDCKLVNEGATLECDIAIHRGRVEQIGRGLSGRTEATVGGAHVMPGMIDDQVHFREPGMEHKATVATESAAAVAGGVTSFLEMPNCIPQTIDADRLEKKHQRASEVAHANYGFYLGATNDNLEEIKRINVHRACGIKVFMGASTGNMLVDDPRALGDIFRCSPLLVATHCEDTPIILENERLARTRFGADVPAWEHPNIRSVEACFKSSSLAVDLAKRHGTRLHVLHLTTEREMCLFGTGALKDKRITAEVCVHHLFFDDRAYAKKGADIKCNPAVKSSEDRTALLRAVIEDRIDVIATDHAPHTRKEKDQAFMDAPAGMPLVQHAIPVLLSMVAEGAFSLETVVNKIAHAPAICYAIKDRGFVREGYWADLVVLDLDRPTVVDEQRLLSKCAWSPFAGMRFPGSIRQTYVNGVLGYDRGRIVPAVKGRAIEYDRA